MTVQEPRDLNGFPNLEADVGRLELDDLPPRPSPLQLAQFYGSVVAAWRVFWRRSVDAAQWLHRAVLGLEASVENTRDALITEIRELRASLVRQGAARGKLPSLAELEPEITANGHVRFSPEAFQALQLKIERLDARAREAAEAERLAEAKAKGAAEVQAAYRVVVEKRHARFFRWAPIVLTAVGLAGAFVHWLLSRSP